MCRKLILLTCLVVVLGLAGAALAETWTGTVDDDWCDPLNWNPQTVPDFNSGDVDIDYTSTRDVRVTCDANAEDVDWNLGAAGDSRTFTIEAGASLEVEGGFMWNDGIDPDEHPENAGTGTIHIYGELVCEANDEDAWNDSFRGPEASSGEVHIYDGARVWTGGRFRGADESTGNVDFYIHGGDVNVAGFMLGDNGSGNFYMTGGTMVCRADVFDSFSIRGRHGADLFVLIDGGADLYVEGDLQSPQDPEGRARININDGLISCGKWAAAGDDWIVDINDNGMLIIRGGSGQDRTLVEQWIDDGKVIGKGGTVTPTITEDGDDLVLALDFLHRTCWDPDPLDEADNVCPGQILTWKTGIYGAAHDIYFGTSLDDVNESATPRKTDHGPNSWDPGVLQLDTTYYWRVDAVNDACSPYVWKGGLWEFTTNDANAYDLSPVDGFKGVSPDVVLSWKASCDATSHNVYFGTSEAPGFVVNRTEPNYNPGGLAEFTTYYWRIEEVPGPPGRVLSFRTGAAGGIVMRFPFDGTPGQDLLSQVTDDTGHVTFDKYIDPCDPGSITYDEPNPWTNSGTSAYFLPEAGLFRDDPEPNTADNPDILRLDGWAYSIEMWIRPDSLPSSDNYVLIKKYGPYGIEIDEDDHDVVFNHNGEDVESDDALEAGEWYHIAAVFDLLYLYPDRTQRLYINGTAVDFEERTGTNPADNNDPVSIGFMRRPDGSSDDYFDGLIDELVIQDIAVGPGTFLLYPGTEVAQNPTPANGDLHVAPNTPMTWEPGDGALHHDVYFGTNFYDVRDANTSSDPGNVYQGQQDANEYQPVTEYGETYHWRIDEVTGSGTQRGLIWHYRIAPEITDPNMRLWYKLDETGGDDVFDSSGYDNHGEIDNDAEWDANGGRFDGALFFDNSGKIVDVSTLLTATITDAITVACWLKDADRPGSDNWVFGIAENDDDDYQVRAAVALEDGRTVEWRAGSDSNDTLHWDMARVGLDPGTLDGWHHWAFVKDESAGTISIYLDGQLADSNGGVDQTLTNIRYRPFAIGAHPDHGDDLVGGVDDFRLYDKGLTESEIAALFRGGEVELPWAPDPLDGATDVLRDASLSWKPGDYAVSHDVYFNTSYELVRDANSTWPVGPVYRDRQGPNSYDPPEVLALGTTYYWRIDEINDSNVDSPWTGNIWRFTVANFLVIDDMETYNTGGNRIYWTWEDGYGNNSGSELALGEDPVDPVHGGVQSMEYVYDNADSKGWYLDYYSEVSVDALHSNLKIGTRDWTNAGVKILTLFFYGQADNDANATEQLYAGLEDTRGAISYAQVDYGFYGEDMDDIREAEWHQWDIGMPDFTGVDANNVGTLYIGFGIRGNPYPGGTPGGAGVVWFDNIRLYPPKCIPWRVKPGGDLNDDCIVDLGDVAEMAEQWLRCDMDVSPVTPPNDANLVAHWELEGNADDSTTNAYHGTAEGAYSWVTGKVGTGAIEVDGGWVVVEDEGNTPKLRMKHYVSVMGWIYIDGEAGEDTRVVIKGEDDEETFGLEVDDEDGAAFIMRDANDLDNVLSVQSGGNAIVGYEWIHIAGTYDQNDQLVYVNGAVEGSSTRGAVELFSDPNDGLGIAGRYGDSGTSGRFDGTIDDVRVYDRAVTRAEIAYLAAGPDGMVELESAANLFDGEDPEVINFRDLDMLLDEWLVEKLWPQ